MVLTLGTLWAVLAAAATTMVLGMIWYGKLFQKPWVEAMGWQDLSEAELKEKQDSAGPGYMMSLAGTVLATVLLWFLYDWSTGMPEGYAPWMKGLVLGFTGFLAFYLPGTLTGTFFHEQSFKLWAISAGYWFVLALAWGAFVGIFH